MYELLTSPNTFPFAIALAVVTGLFLLELLSAVLGGSILGVGTDAPDVDADFDFDLSTEIDADIDIDVDVVDGPEGAEAAEAATSVGCLHGSARAMYRS